MGIECLNSNACKKRIEKIRNILSDSGSIISGLKRLAFGNCSDAVYLAFLRRTSSARTVIPMTVSKLSPKQRLTVNWWKNPKYRNFDAIICDGAVRSGKTLSMSLGFILWASSIFQRRRHFCNVRKNYYLSEKKRH